jgi:hypothetical protein
MGRMKEPWSWRDCVAAVGLFAATALVVFWQNSRVTVLWDLSYVLDSSYRITLGQLPYRDFPFAHAPLTFLIQSAIIRLAGRVFWHHVVYCAVVGGLGSVVTWRVALRMLGERAWGTSVLLAVPLAFLGVYGIFPHPNYDCDCAFAVLVAIWLLQRVERGIFGGFGAGVAIVLPVFFKQNIGLPFLLAVVCGMVALAVFRERSGPFAVLAGALSGLAGAAMALHWTVGIGNYIEWTVRFPAQRRIPSMGAMVGIYRDASLYWMIPCVAVGIALVHPRWVKTGWARMLGFCLLAVPFCWPIVVLFHVDDAEDRASSLLALWPLVLILAAVVGVYGVLRWVKEGRIRELSATSFSAYRQGGLDRALVPFFLLAAINGAFLSQQLWGSTYATWPLLMLLIAGMIGRLERRWMAPALAGVIGVSLLVAGGFYVASEDRLSYAAVSDGELRHSTLPELAGMSVRGPYLPNFEELAAFAGTNIPLGDGLILVNGEDPFYYTTGRTPRFPILLFDPTTQPYSPQKLRELAVERNIRWLVVKRDLQIREDPTPDRAATLAALMEEFVVEQRLAGYDVYRRR